MVVTTLCCDRKTGEFLRFSRTVLFVIKCELLSGEGNVE